MLQKQLRTEPHSMLKRQSRTHHHARLQLRMLDMAQAIAAARPGPTPGRLTRNSRRFVLIKCFSIRAADANLPTRRELHAPARQSTDDFIDIYDRRTMHSTHLARIQLALDVG